MAIIYSYPTVNPERTDLILGTDVSSSNKATKNFTIQSVIDLVTVATGDLQTVLDLGNVATGRDINLTNNAFRGGNFVTTGGVSITGTTATGFTNVNSTAFTGTIATPVQPNITSLGTLSALVISGPISGTGLITNSNLTGAQNDNVVSTLAIKTYVDTKVGLYDTLQEVLANGNTTSGSDIAVSAGDDITFTDTSKVILGTGSDATIEHDGTDLKIVNTEGKTTISNSSGDIDISATATAKKLILNGKAGVNLNFEGSKKIETLVGGAKVTGAFEATTSGTFASLINTGSYSDSSGDIGTAGQILSSTGSGTNWVTEVPLYSWSLEGTAIPSGTAVTVTDGTNITTTWDAANFDLTIATTGVPDGSGAANQVTYWSDADTLTGAAGFTFAGGATGKVAIAGELEVGGVLTDGTFTGSSGTYTGYTSITSTDFVGALTGNASTATALASSGAIALTGDTVSTGGPYTYTSGGAISIATTIADTTVTGKVLTNLPTPTSAAIAASDTILAAMAKLQGQITGIPQGLVYKGTWNASTNTPTLASGTGVTGEFYIVSVAGATNLDGITDWQVGDWAIFVEVGATDTWQKIDNTSAILGSGTANKIAKWTGSNTLATGLIADDGTTVTVGNSGNFVVEGNTTLGDADTDSTTVKGPAVFEETLRINEGISLGAATYGTAGQVLTSGGGSASVNTWTTPTTGTVTSVGYTHQGNAFTVGGVPVTSSGVIAVTMAGSASQYINGAGNLTTFPTLDNYVSWTLAGDSGPSQTISSTNTATFAGGFGITTLASATDTLTTSIDITGVDNAIAGLTAATPIATDTLWFNDISDSNTIRKATIASIVDLGNETLAQVLSNGNTTGGTDITVSAGDDITFTSTSKAIFNSALQIINDGSNSYIQDVGTGDLRIDTNAFRLRSANGGETMITAFEDGAVNLMYNDITRLSTTNAGITVTGDGDFSGQIFVGAQNSTFAENNLRFLSTGGAYIDHGVTSQDINFRVSNSSSLDTTAMIIKSDGDVEFKDNVEIDGNLTVDGDIIHGGGKSGIFNGSKSFTGGAAAATLFRLTRTTTGALIFDVYLTSATSGYSCKKYTVAHKLNTAPNYNKIIDSGAATNGDYVVTFTNDGQGVGGDTVKCEIAATTTQDIHYTIQVGQGATAVTRYTS